MKKEALPPCEDCPNRWVKDEGGKVTSCRSSCQKWTDYETHKMKCLASPVRTRNQLFAEYIRSRRTEVMKASKAKYRRW